MKGRVEVGEEGKEEGLGWGREGAGEEELKGRVAVRKGREKKKGRGLGKKRHNLAHMREKRKF